MMADNCDQPETIDEMFKKAEEGFDVICGSRYMRGGKKMGGPFLQTFFSRFVGLSLRLISGIPTYDVSNAFKMYRKEVLNVIAVAEDGFAMSMELTVKAYLNGFKVCEVPTIWRERTAGQSNFRIFKVASSYIRIYMLSITGVIKRLGRKK